MSKGSFGGIRVQNYGGNSLEELFGTREVDYNRPIQIKQTREQVIEQVKQQTKEEVKKINENSVNENKVNEEKKILPNEKIEEKITEEKKNEERKKEETIEISKKELLEEYFENVDTIDDNIKMYMKVKGKQILEEVFEKCLKEIFENETNKDWIKDKLLIYLQK